MSLFTTSHSLLHLQLPPPPVLFASRPPSPPQFYFVSNYE